MELNLLDDKEWNEMYPLSTRMLRDGVDAINLTLFAKFFVVLAAFLTGSHVVYGATGSSDLVLLGTIWGATAISWIGTAMLRGTSAELTRVAGHAIGITGNYINRGLEYGFIKGVDSEDAAPNEFTPEKLEKIQELMDTLKELQGEGAEYAPPDMDEESGMAYA